MAHVAPIYPNFARGEVSPLMFGRIDIEQYPTCLDKCRNTFIRPYGCASRLTGTEFIANAKNNGKARLLKFVFSATDSYIIECGAGYFRFYQDGQQVLNSNNEVYEIQNSYSEEQLKSIQYVQLDDIIKLVCLPDPNHPNPNYRGNKGARPKELIRRASNDWVFRDVEFKETPYLDQNTTNITMKASATTGNDITITASSSYFEPSLMVGANMWIGTKVKDDATNKDVQGYVQFISNANNSSTVMHAKVMSKLSTDTATKLWGEGAFSDYRGYPAVVALYDGRLYYARTPHQPRNVYGSKPYAYETFTPAVDNEDDAGINIQLATNANGDGSDIKWMIGASYLLCGTYGGEFVIRGSGDGAITATDISARQRTNWGGEPVQPIVAGTFVHFLQRNGNKLRQFQYDFYYDSYKAVDVSIFSEHLLSSPIKEMALQKNPDSIIYLMREDGKVVMLTLEQDQSVQAWSLLEELGAEVESIQTIPSFYGNYDEVYILMKRQALATELSYQCSNPALTITDDYTETKETAGQEVITLTYNGNNGVWTTPESTELETTLNVASSNPSLTVTTSYNQTKPQTGTITEVLKCTSTGGWTQAYQDPQLATQSNWQSITYGNGIYLARGARTTKYLATSKDGVNWSTPFEAVESDQDDKFKFTQSIAYGNGVFVAVGTSRNYVSTDAINWDVSTSRGGDIFTNVIFDGEKFVVIDTQVGVLRTSTDGIIWQITGTYGGFAHATYLAFNGSIYVINSPNGYIYTSTDLTNWTSARPTGIPDAFLWDMIMGYDGSRFFGTYNGQISYSTDGINWTTPVTDANLGNYNWKASTTNDIKTVLISPDGFVSGKTKEVWQSQTTGLNVNLNSDNYKISLSGTPSVNDTLTCTWTTISGYTEPSNYDLTITGTPSNGDTITLTYDTDFTGSQRFIERMCDPITPANQNDWWYVRSGLKYDGFELTEGNNLTLSGNQGTVTATADSNIFTENKVGNRIRFIDSDYNILGEGTITAYTSQTQVTLDITTYFQSSTMTGGSWGISTDTVSGLDHLDGREVQVFADGVEQENKEVVDGSIDVDDAFIIVAGLPYTSYITTMPMEAGSQNGTAVGKRKRISEMAIRVWNTIGVKVGRDLNNLYDTIYKQKEPFTGVIPNIKYNQGWVWDANITVEQSHPYPMNILSIAPIVTEVDK